MLWLSGPVLWVRAPLSIVSWLAGRLSWWNATLPGRRLPAGQRACSSRSRRMSCAPGSPGAASPKRITFADWAGVPLTVASPGSFLIARTAQHRQFLCQELAQSRRWGADVREATRAQFAWPAHYYRPAGDDFVLWCPEDAYIEEPASLIQACMAACRRHGAVVAENEPVIGIPITAGRVTGVETERRSITAPVVVDAAGGWVRQVAGLAGARVPVAQVRHQLLITEPTAHVDPADPIIRVADAAVYLRPARGGLMFGGFEPDPMPVDPGLQAASFTTDDVPLDLDVLRQLADQVTAEVPAVSTVPVAEHRGGLFTMSPDGRFVAGPVSDMPGLWVASGCNGSGFSSSLAIGEALATWITSEAPPPGMAALSPGRFGARSDEALLTRGLWHTPMTTTPSPATSGAFPRHPAPRRTARTGTRPLHRAAGSERRCHRIRPCHRGVPYRTGSDRRASPRPAQRAGFHRADGGISLSSASEVAVAIRCRHSPSAAVAACQATANCRAGLSALPAITAFSHLPAAVASPASRKPGHQGRT